VRDGVGERERELRVIHITNQWDILHDSNGLGR
jgi:hypothetical protein